MFGAEVYAIAQAIEVIDQRQERVHQYTIFVDSTSAVGRIRTDAIGLGQSFGIAAIEGCSRVMSRDSEITVRWVPAHNGVPGNEKADEYAKAAAEGERPDSTVPDELRWEASLSHMTRVATEARSRRTRQWISERLGDPQIYGVHALHSVKRWWRVYLFPQLHHQHLSVSNLCGPVIRPWRKEPIAAWSESSW